MSRGRGDRYGIPRFITTRAFKRRTDELRIVDQRLKEVEDLLPFLGLARTIREKVHRHDGTNQEAAIRIATAEAERDERESVVQEIARKLRVTLSDEVAKQIRAAVEQEEQETGKIHNEVAAQFAEDEPQLRKKFRQETETDLKRLNRDELLRRLEIDEAADTLRRFGELALRKEQRRLLVETLKQTALETHSVVLSDLPEDSVICIGLGAFNTRNNRSDDLLQGYDRVLRFRILDPLAGALQILDDSWRDLKDDDVRKGLALADLTYMSLAPCRAGKPHRLDLGAEPKLFFEDGQPMELFGMEVKKVVFDDAVIMGPQTKQ